ncbi:MULTISPECIES: hypothetical protein [Bacillus]|nr:MULTISPECIES: hypothetical protein [Bacillus]
MSVFAIHTKRLFVRRPNVENVNHNGRLLSYFEYPTALNEL